MWDVDFDMIKKVVIFLQNLMPPLILNGVSDSWTDCCLYVDNKVIYAIATTFDRLFHYDCFITVGFLILIIFPILFKLYEFGLQQRLRMFYDHSRVIFINFIFLCSFSLAISTIMHLSVQQPMPCITWDGDNIVPFRTSSRTPNEGIILLMILCHAIWIVDIELKIIRRIASILVFNLYVTFVVLNGESSISQILVSFFVGIWIISVHHFVPPIGTIILSVGSSIFVFALFGVVYPTVGWSTHLIRESLHLVFRSGIVLLVTVYQLARFGYLRRHFDWFKTNWELNRHVWMESTAVDAVIPSTARDSTKDNFGNLLSNDLIDGAVGFIVYLLGNFLLLRLDQHFDFMFE
ncbi:hypothetical protein TRFO_10357 [Tritrichomonas foetus]|uniref:Uncharacterized protein n=1 Tax=Tritrichomonas foetus TaxID=1144522 RepID=A0A1J4JDF9_9EUKA|nr:hypothetical protein TRFO_10357 [Tritrichomonas foetus]|eukprot:OHS95715.1 hypothetical protein TRFO_10357 [Tritrichomonas foetus]